MAIEYPMLYIGDLNTSNPAGSASLSESDDHLRGLKTVLKTTFTGGASGLTGAVTVTHTELNRLAGVTSAVQTQLNQQKPTWTTVSTSPYSAADGGWYLVRTNSIAITVNLPAGSAGAITRVKDADFNAASNNITITPNGAETIEGQANLVIDVSGGSVALQYLNSSWRLI